MDRTLWVALISPVVFAALIGVIAALVNAIPTRTTARAALRKVELDEKIAASDEERKAREALRKERDEYHDKWRGAEERADKEAERADRAGEDLAAQRFRCARIGRPCEAPGPAPLPALPTIDPTTTGGKPKP